MAQTQRHASRSRSPVKNWKQAVIGDEPQAMESAMMAIDQELNDEGGYYFRRGSPSVSKSQVFNRLGKKKQTPSTNASMRNLLDLE